MKSSADMIAEKFNRSTESKSLICNDLSSAKVLSYNKKKSILWQSFLFRM